MGEPRCSSSAIPRNLEQADLGRSTPPLATLVYTETKMSTHKHSEAGNELRSLSMIRYDQSMNATTQRSKDRHFWHLTPLPAHRQVHTSHTPTSGCTHKQPRPHPPAPKAIWWSPHRGDREEENPPLLPENTTPARAHSGICMYVFRNGLRAIRTRNCLFLATLN